MPNDHDALLCRKLLKAATLTGGAGLALLASQHPVIPLLLAAGGLFGPLRDAGRTLFAHGTARFATVADLLKDDKLSEEGLIMGKVVDAERPSLTAAVSALFNPSVETGLAARLGLAAVFGGGQLDGRMVRVKDFQNVLTVSRTGGGKGVGAAIPNLLAYPNSCVVVDVKNGELHRATASHRRRVLKNRIIRLDPAGIFGPGADTYNPIAHIGIHDPALLMSCRDVANQLVVRTGEEREPVWNDSAELAINCILSGICALEPDPELRNFQTLRGIVSSREKFAEMIDLMRCSTALGGRIARLGSLLGWYVDRELGSVMTTVQRHTQFLDYPEIAENTAASTFDPMDLRRGQPTTVYLILPADWPVVAPMMRLWIGGLLREMTL